MFTFVPNGRRIIKSKSLAPPHPTRNFLPSKIFLATHDGRHCPSDGHDLSRVDGSLPPSFFKKAISAAICGLPRQVALWGVSRLAPFRSVPAPPPLEGAGTREGGVVILRHRRSPHKMREPARGSGIERIPALVLPAEALCVWLAAPAVHLSQPESWGSPRIQIGDLSPPCAAEIAPAFLRCLGERRVGTRQ